MTAKRDVNIIPFSHLDLFWAGTREECLSRGGKIIVTAMDLLDQYPEYRFMIESTNFIETYLDCYPEETERMKRLIAEGRLEIIPMRSIIYSHLPAGETTIRNLTYGKRYCREHLDAEPTIMSLSDIPGVIAQLPQIAKLGGMTEIILSRGFHQHTDHVSWTAPDGSEVKAYCPWHYASLTGRISNENYAEMIAKEDEFEAYVGAVDYPQIIHWGMDLYVFNENIMKNVQRWNQDGRRRLVFSTFREFFDRHPNVETKKFAGEIPSSWPNIESSWPDIWPLDVPIENDILLAEYFGALNILAGNKNDYPKDTMERAWLNLLDAMDHNQNGIGGDIADADKLDLKRHAQLTAQAVTDRYAWRMAARTTTPNELAAPIVVFNPLSWKRDEIINARTACYGKSFATIHHCFNSKPYHNKHEYKLFRLINAKGEEIPYKLENHHTMLADTFEVSFYAKDIPAQGCATFYIEPLEEPEPCPSPFTVTLDSDADRVNPDRYAGSDIVENEFFKLEIKRVTGEISLFDKKRDRMIFANARIVGFEEKRGEYIYNMDLTGRVMPAIIDSIDVIANNAVYCRIAIKGSVYSQPFTQLVTMSADAPVIDMENTIDWRENRYVRIEQAFDFAANGAAEIRYGSPFGQTLFPETIYQKADGEPDPEFVNHPTRDIRLARNWVDIADATSGVTIGSDHRMWTFDGDTLRNCMVRGIGWTSGGVKIKEDGSREANQRPPKGEYSFRFRIKPRDAGSLPDGRIGWELNAPLHSVAMANASVAETPGLTLPPMLDTSDSSVIVSCVKPSDIGDNVAFRCFESVGVEASLTLPQRADRQWTLTDLMEENEQKITGDVVNFRPYEIKTLISKSLV